MVARVVEEEERVLKEGGGHGSISFPLEAGWIIPSLSALGSLIGKLCSWHCVWSIIIPSPPLTVPPPANQNIPSGARLAEAMAAYFLYHTCGIHTSTKKYNRCFLFPKMTFPKAG